MPRQPSPQVPIVSYPVPVITDFMVVDEWNTQDGSYTALPYGSRHPNVSKFSGYFLVKQQPSDKDKWVHRIWVADPEAEDTYNLAREEFDQEDTSFPTYIRRYEVRRNTYGIGGAAGPLAKGSKLTGVVAARITVGGSGYDTPPTVTPSGGAGTGATFTALIFRGVVVWIVVTAQGTGYTSAPSLAFSGGGGTLAAATASIQSTEAILTKEWVERQEESSSDSAYIKVIRVYQTVPGATTYSRRFLKTGFIGVTSHQRVLAATRPAGGNLVLLDRVTPESTVTAIRDIETTTNSDGTAASANAIYAFDEIDEKENVVRIRYEQDQPASTAVDPNLDTAYGTSKIRIPGNGGTTAILTGITVTAPGTGYTSVPTVTIAPPTGSSPVTALATATLAANSAEPAANGSGYASGNTVTPSGCTGTAPVFTISGFALATLALLAGGTGQDIGDQITLVGGTFTTAGVVRILTVSLAGVTPIDVGSGYALGELVDFVGGTSSPSANGTVATLCVADTPAVNAAGTGYVRGDTLTLVGGTNTTPAAPKVAFIKLVSITGAGGSGYVPGDDIYCQGGTFANRAVLDVTSTKVTAIAAITVAGTGGAPGAQIATGTTGTGTKFQVAVTVSAGGVITATGAIGVAGSYTLNPNDIASEPVSVTGGGLGDARLSVSMGVNAVTVPNGGKYITGSATLTQAPYVGSSGTGATFTSGVFGVESIYFDTFASRGNYTFVPSTFTCSGGTGTDATFQSAAAGVRTITMVTAGAFTVTDDTLTSTAVNGSGATFTPSFAALTIELVSGGAYTGTLPTSFTSGATTGSGTGATFDTPTWTPTLTLTSAGSCSAIPANPAATTTNGAGINMTLTIDWGVGATTLTNSGQGYLIPNPKVTFTGGGGSGARAIANNALSVWNTATAYIIDGGMEDKQGTTLKTVWWLVAPIPPVRREYPWHPFSPPDILHIFDGEYISPFVARLGVNYSRESPSAGTHPMRLTIQSQLGEWTDIQPSWEVISRMAGSNYFRGVGDNVIHDALVVYDRDGETGALTLVESIPASTPSYDEYDPEGVYMVREWMERVWDSGIWQKFTLEYAQGYVVGLDGVGPTLPYFGSSTSGFFRP